MDIKKMLLDMAEVQADQMKEDMLSYLSSEEMSDNIATKINEKIDIPFVSEDKEQIFFERIVDIITDVLEDVFKKK